MQHFYNDISQQYDPLWQITPDVQEHQGKREWKVLAFVYERKGKKLGKKSTGQDTTVFAHDEQHLHACEIPQFLISLLINSDSLAGGEM